jgi:hypothetical protein
MVEAIGDVTPHGDANFTPITNARKSGHIAVIVAHPCAPVMARDHIPRRVFRNECGCMSARD